MVRNRGDDRAVLTTWAPDALLVLPVALAAAYGALLLRHRAAHRRGDAPAYPTWRAVPVALGVLLLAWAVAGWPAARRAAEAWPLALSVGLVTAVVPFLVGLGDPVRLLEEGRGAPVALLHGRLARVLTFPLVASVLSAAVLTVAVTSGWFTAARTDATAWWTLQVVALVLGLLVTVPLLVEGLLPAWCGPALRALFAFSDGLLDAVPGIVALGSLDWLTGQTLVAVAESVGVPLVLVTLVQWARADEEGARALDARLDAAAPPAARTSPPDGTTGPTDDAAAERPWWESDPRLAGRYGRR